MDYCKILNSAETISLIFKSLTVMIMVIAAIRDIREKQIPLIIPIVQMVFSLIYFLYLWTRGMDNPKGLLLSMLPGLALLGVGYITRQGIGFGDGLMILSLGPLFGMANIMLITLLSFTLSAIVGGTLLILKKAGGKSAMAFMPFLTVGVGVISFAVI